MSARTDALLRWSPRVGAMAFAAFLAVFALDGFAEGQGFVDTAVQVLLHAVPALIVLVTLAVAWRWEWLGAVAFVGLAASYVITAWGRFPLATYVAVAGPAALIGVLFLLSGMARGRTTR